jgi:DNA-directed RNA polymerase subunit E'/Rpb7
MELYRNNILKRRVTLSFDEVGSNVMSIIKRKLVDLLEGKCIEEGILKRGTIKVEIISSGFVEHNCIYFDVSFSCEICCPSEGMIISNCIVKNISKAGVKCEVNSANSPLTIFIVRDLNFDNDDVTSLSENDIIAVKVIGQRYELNDKTISVIANINTN